MASTYGRFVTQDTFEGRIQNPISRNRFLYANANPVNLSDPSGKFAIYASTVAALSVYSDLTASYWREAAVYWRRFIRAQCAGSSQETVVPPPDLSPFVARASFTQNPCSQYDGVRLFLTESGLRAIRGASYGEAGYVAVSEKVAEWVVNGTGGTHRYGRNFWRESASDRNQESVYYEIVAHAIRPPAGNAGSWGFLLGDSELNIQYYTRGLSYVELVAMLSVRRGPGGVFRHLGQFFLEPPYFGISWNFGTPTNSTGGTPISTGGTPIATTSVRD
jgi:hypothetical protein